MQRPATRPAVTAGCLVVAALGVPLALAHANALARAYAPPPPPPPVSVAEPEPVAPVNEEPVIVETLPPAAQAPAGIEARWGSSWYPVTPVADVCTGYVRIRFTGYGEDWDSVVPTGDLRAEGSTSQGLMPDVSETEPDVSSDETESPDHLPLPAGHRLRVGEALMVEWHGTWWDAHVRGLRAGGARIGYDGYDTSSDETVTRDRLGLRVPERNGERTAGASDEEAQPSGRSVQGSDLRVGQRLLARQGPSWRHARVTGFACGGLVSVHYAGRDATFDEFVPRDRLQLEATE